VVSTGWELWPVNRRDRVSQREYSALEEAINAATHGIGAVLSLPGLIILIAGAADTDKPWGVLAVTLFGLTLFLVYLSSTIHHALRNPEAKRIFLLCDHCAIFLLIAGTFTPFAVFLLPEEIGRELLATVWVMALIGVALKVLLFFAQRFERFDRLCVIIYMGMGWYCLAVSGDFLLESLPGKAFLWLIGGGLLYTVGVIFYLWRSLRFGHALWHLLSLSGSACHFICILLYVVPAPV
jgi:hemolysin III